MLHPPHSQAGRIVGRVICTTIAENEEMMCRLFSFLDEVKGNDDTTDLLRTVGFRPSIPNLVYQYKTYTNYESQRLATRNPEINED